jgi:hypothetical protein
MTVNMIVPSVVILSNAFLIVMLTVIVPSVVAHFQASLSFSREVQPFPNILD